MSFTKLSSSTKLAIGAGLAAAALGLGYYLVQRNQKKHRGGRAPGRVVDTITKQQVLDIIDEIADAQTKMKAITQKAIEEVVAKKMGLDQVYDLCLNTQPPDPLQKHGITTGEFDLLLDREQHDPVVRERLAKVIGYVNEQSSASVHKIKLLEPKQVIAIHEFMLTELKHISDQITPKLNKGIVDLRVLAIAAQVLVGARVFEKFAVETDDIEASLLQHHETLSNDAHFANINEEIQELMAKFFDIMPVK